MSLTTQASSSNCDFNEEEKQLEVQVTKDMMEAC